MMDFSAGERKSQNFIMYLAALLMQEIICVPVASTFHNISRVFVFLFFSEQDDSQQQQNLSGHFDLVLLACSTTHTEEISPSQCLIMSLLQLLFSTVLFKKCYLESDMTILLMRRTRKNFPVFEERNCITERSLVSQIIHTC